MDDLDIPGLSIKFLQDVMPSEKVAYMLAGNVPVHFSKDILSSVWRCVCGHGHILAGMTHFSG
jgi:hypothetical protein